MNVFYQTCCGVDVHKSFLAATIIKTTSGVKPSYHKKRFSTFNNSILQFKEWLTENKCRDVCMESIEGCQMIDSLIAPYENAVQLLCTIPGLTVIVPSLLPLELVLILLNFLIPNVYAVGQD